MPDAEYLTGLLSAERDLLENVAQEIEGEPLGQAEDLAAAFVAAEELHKVVGLLKDELEQRLVKAQSEKHGKTAEYPGLGTMEIVRSSSKTTWDHERLLGVAISTALARRGEDVNEDGEILAPEVAIERVLSDCAAFSYWRLGALERYEIDGKQFRHTEPGRTRIKRTK